MEVRGRGCLVKMLLTNAEGMGSDVASAQSRSLMDVPSRQRSTLWAQEVWTVPMPGWQCSPGVCPTQHSEAITMSSNPQLHGRDRKVRRSHLQRCHLNQQKDQSSQVAAESRALFCTEGNEGRYPVSMQLLDTLCC